MNSTETAEQLASQAWLLMMAALVGVSPTCRRWTLPGGPAKEQQPIKQAQKQVVLLNVEMTAS